ncbi:hypothetical protein FNV43_RR24094 [Rhamnella rubrinervis]|uniref:Low-temperature-induced 65 kDa protein n=1 Tax=Rhamnella rubrinervis TaxID=2594499 RepID=A0A8K0DKV5_9ROSA|nr:hypothetical protein FNV43_RR24094 [Rhamnella rubrinervis]
MDSQMERPSSQSHTHENDPQNAGIHAEGDDHHDEKPSVMTKMKAKAKKIKDTLKKHGYGHNQDHDHDDPHDGHVPDDHDLEEENDEYEEMVKDPEVQGAPIYDSAAIKTGALGGISETAVGSAAAMPHGHGHEQPLASKDISGVKSSDPTRISVPGLEENIAQPKSNFGKPSLMGEEEPHALLNTPVPSFSHGAYETKDSTDPSTIFVSGSTTNLGESRVNLERPKGLEEDPHASKEFNRQDYTPSNYQTKVSDPTGAGTEEIGATPILSSFDKMSIDDESEAKGQSKLITQAPTGSHDQFSPETFPPKPSDTPQNPNAMEENLDTRDRNDRDTAEINPTNATSYTEKLSSASSVIADKAISTKNVVASKLGYGEKDDSTDHRVHDDEAHGSGDGSTAKPSSTVEYGKKIAATVTDKLTPVYEKVAGAGSTGMSKMSGTGATGAGSEAEKSEVKGQDKGVSVKDFLAEKLRPGDEDRALSEVISDSLHKRKQEPEESESGPPMGEVTQSEEVTKRLGTGDEKSERQERDEPATGYVNNPQTGGGGGDGKGVVGKLKGAVGSWFGLGGGDQSSQTSHVGDGRGHSAAASVGEDSISKDEPRLQESGN